MSADNSKEEINQVAAEWGQSQFDVLISTTIALVGNENPKCRHLACAGYLFDMMQMVQFFGRLRPYMRSTTGQVLVCVPTELPGTRKANDARRWSRLFNDQFMGHTDYSKYEAAMTSQGLYKWVKNAASTNGSCCALKNLSIAMDSKRNEDCGACNFCRSTPVVVVQAVAQNRINVANSNGTACGRVLDRLANVCFVCGKSDCSGIAFGNSQRDSNGRLIVGCLSPQGCWTCGGTKNDHKRGTCFDYRSCMTGKACWQCWVFRDVPGGAKHDTKDCRVKWRFRRLVLDHYHKYVEPNKNVKFNVHAESIYSKKESFFEFMMDIESKYMPNDD